MVEFKLTNTGDLLKYTGYEKDTAICDITFIIKDGFCNIFEINTDAADLCECLIRAAADYGLRNMSPYCKIEEKAKIELIKETCFGKVFDREEFLVVEFFSGCTGCKNKND